MCSEEEQKQDRCGRMFWFGLFIKALWLPADSKLCRLEEMGFAAGVQIPLPAATFQSKGRPFPLQTPWTGVGGATQCLPVARLDMTSGHCRPCLRGQSQGKAAWEDQQQPSCYSFPWRVAWQAGAACLLFELTRPLDNLFLESELQEALGEQESWMWPGQLCAYG